MKQEIVVLPDKPFDPYKNFDYTKYEFDVVAFWEKFYGMTPQNNFNDCHPIFEKLISEIKPNLIFELGSYKGKSAIHMANLTKKYNTQCKIICIDTWLGSAEHFNDEDLSRVDGYPTLFYQFLANVMHTNNQDVIVPLPIDTISEYRILKQNNCLADMIYVDAGHFYESVSVDIKLYWELLKPGGVMLGDDYSNETWDGVVKAVHEFFPEDEIHVDKEKWWVYKKPEPVNNSWSW